MTTPVGTIIIPAHNEAAVLGRCLEALRPIIEHGQVRVVVACNGCSDDTVQIARREDGVLVVEIPVASKAAALRAGDLLACPGPRIYLDADVVMTARATLAVIQALHPGSVLAARPPIRFEAAGARWPVRFWYAVRVRLPSIRSALWGAGTYALSVEGRARFDEFPDIVSDDLFIDRLFAEQESAIVPTDPVVVRTPRTTSDLLRILVRTYRTQSDVARNDGAAPVSAGQLGQLRDLVALVLRRPPLIVAAMVYVALIAVARIRAGLKSGNDGWERDNSSREGSPA